MHDRHAPLSAFLADLYEQCDLYAGTAGNDQFVKLVIEHVKLMLVSAGYVVQTDASRIIKTKDE